MKKNAVIAVAQVDAKVGDIAANIRHHVRFIERAIAKKADLIVFPELSLTGYSVKDLAWDTALRPEAQPVLAPMLRLSKKISIVVGCIEEAENYGMYNSVFLFENGAVRSVHRKVYPPTYGMFEERRYFNAGNDVRVVTSNIGEIGVLVCEDLWHLPLPYILAHDGAEIIIGIAASPVRISGGTNDLSVATVNHEHHRVFARLVSTYLVWSNRVGIEDGVTFWGGSQIVDPSGTTVATAKQFEEDLIIAKLNDNEIRRARRFSRHFTDDDVRFTIEQLRSSLQRRTKEP